MSRVPLAWLQLKRDKLRLAAAVAGVTFGVVLIFMQLGFREALFDSAVRYHNQLGYDLVMVSPKTDFIVQPMSFPRARLFQLTAVEGVQAVTPVYLAPGRWRNPANPTETRSIFVVGFDPDRRGFPWPELDAYREAIRTPDQVIFDRASREEFGPVPALVESQGSVRVEVNDRALRVVGLFELGTSFGIDGSLLTSDLNFLRLFPDRDASHVDLGLVHLAPGANSAATRERILAAIPGDVVVLERKAFVEREVAYWNSSTPIGYVFSFGVVMGLVVGLIIVYQILFADVQDSLSEYATLKAMGYTHGYLVGVVMREAALLGLFAYLPAFGLTLLIYQQAGAATHLPIVMTPERALAVLGLTVGMCICSGVLAIRKLRSAEPAEVF